MAKMPIVDKSEQEQIMQNIPEMNIGIAAVSRDCFPVELSKKRLMRLVKVCQTNKVPVIGLDTIIERESDVTIALNEIKNKKINSLVIFLGNFGPEGPISLLAQKFHGPVMMAAAAEETGENLIQGRGDAYCGLLSASFNMGLRRLNPYLPERPVGTAEELSREIADFLTISRIVYGVKNLKIISFGPRPQDFYTCHTPIQSLFDLGVEVMENSELDLLDIVQGEAENPEIENVIRQMSQELGTGNTHPDLLKKLAQYELALKNYHKQNLGTSQFAVFANKCWPAFEKNFGHVPCYINSRMAAQGIPIACEADIFGAFSEYMALCAGLSPTTLLDINNTVPADMVQNNRKQVSGYKPHDLWMGFHCGNTSSSCLVGAKLQHQLIMHRLMEPGQEPDITRGTLEGQIKPGPFTMFRLQATPENHLQAYAAEGEVLDINPQSFGSIGVFAIKEMGRFYRHVLLEKRFPHHTAIAFNHVGKFLFPALRMLGLKDIFSNLRKDIAYPTEYYFS